jgi:hypothetical protein
MILFSKLYEREGNDSWLKDYVEIRRNPFGLFLEHSVHHSGWAGEIKESYKIELDCSDIPESQIKVNKYLNDHLLDDEIKIELIEIFTKNYEL